MSTLSDLLAEHSDLSGSAVARLQAVVSEWQLLADLSFSDLLLWVPTGTGVMICAAQARPTTGVTAFVDDRVSCTIEPSEFPLLRHAWEEERVMSEPPPLDAPSSWIRREVIPVRHLDGIIALIERDTSSMVGREASLLETAYVDAADDLFQMVADGTFPPSEHPGEMHTGPRAGDGLLRLVGMLRTGHHVELLDHRSPEAVLRKHAADRLLEHEDRALGHEHVVPGPFDAAGIAGVAVGDLLHLLATRELDLVGVHDDHVVTRVHVGREDRLVLAAQDGRDLRGKTPQYLAAGINHVPAAHDVLGLRRVGLHT